MSPPPGGDRTSSSTAATLLEVFLTFVAGVSLWFAGVSLAGTSRLIADLLPGVGTFEPPGATARAIAAWVIPGLLFAYLLCGLRLFGAGERRHLVRGSLNRLATLAGAMLNALGLRTLTPTRLLLQILAGVAGGLTAIILAGLTAHLGTWPTPANDPRDVIAAHASTAAAAIHGFIAAPPGEELVYRGPLLFAAAGLRPLRIRWPRLCQMSMILILLLTSYLFGTLHVQFGVLNVVTATINGLIWGILALRARSIVPALVGHGLYNALAFAGQTL